MSLQGCQRWKELYLKAFLLGCIPLAITLLPLVIFDKGYFIYYGDFISQQLPFYSHANDVVRNGGLLGWDWGTDLGSSFIGSYAFYLSGSPFFWITVLLPKDWVLFAIPWLLCLKHGFACLTAYAYIRRFVQNPTACLIGGMLYTYSGFQMFNLFFNHFQDVTAFFPLMLIAMEEVVNHHKRGVFALVVALMAFINYFFFAGQAVFLVIYFLVRMQFSKDFKINWKKYFALFAEAVIGVYLAGVVLVPAAMAILANERVSQMLFGQDMIFYSDKTRILRIIQSFFMTTDPPARPILFETTRGKWASIGGYLPMFSMAGGIAFMGQKKKHWASILTGVCIVCAFVPVLNSAFYMLNGAYYARWYYMPILIMALMTAYALDNPQIQWKNAAVICVALPVIFGIMGFIPTKNEDDETEFFKFATIYPYLWVQAGVTLVLCGLLWLIVSRRIKGKSFLKLASVLTVFSCMAVSMTMVYFGKAISIDSKEYIQEAIHGKEHLSISYETDEDSYFRVDMSEDYDNYPMFWELSSMRCFQSVVNPNIMKFYDEIGITRDVASRAEPEHYTLRGLFSVKYFFQKIQEDDDGNQIEPDIAGFSFLREENGFRIYQNDYFIPMGFTYDSYITSEQLEGKTDKAKENMLIFSLLLDDEQAELYSDIIQKADTDKMVLDTEHYLNECEIHQQHACENFSYSAKGFSADITLDEPKLVFFSVPYETGWSATVNGNPVTVEEVSNGFMAVRCEAGANQIVFSYELTGLWYGILLSTGGIVLLIIYMLCSKPLFEGVKHVHSYDYLSVSGIRAEKAYIQYLREQELERSRVNGTSERNQT